MKSGGGVPTGQMMGEGNLVPVLETSPWQRSPLVRTELHGVCFLVLG